MAKKPLPAKHPMAELEQNELLSESTAQNQLDDGLTKALLAAEKAKNRAKSIYGRRIVSMVRTDLIRLEKLLRRWERQIEEAL